MLHSIPFSSALLRMLILIVLVSMFLYPIDSFKIGLPSAGIEPPVPADISGQSTPKNDEQPVAIEGQFILAEGNSDHLFRTYDFVKEDAVQLNEGDTVDTKNDEKVRRLSNAINPSLPRIQIIEGCFISYENGSDKHLFAEEDFEKHNTISI